MSKPATLQKILNIEKHPNADALDIATILGWQCVVKKDQFKIGELVVYVEVDSFLPMRPEFDFLQKNCYKKLEDGTEGYRIKNVKLRGQLSQGLVFPVTILDCDKLYGGEFNIECFNEKEGFDVSENLNIKHYEKPIPSSLRGKVEGAFPSNLLPKTDEERLQNIPEIIATLTGKPYYISTKDDGTSATFIYDKGKFMVCSRNLELSFNPYSENTYWKMATENNLEEILEKHYNMTDESLSFQGEIVGQGIQKNPLGLEKVELRIFNIRNLDTNSYLTFPEFIEFCKVNNIKTVDIEEVGDNFNYTLTQLLERAKGVYKSNGKTKEGIVIRSQFNNIPVRFAWEPNEAGVMAKRVIESGRISFKVINNEYDDE